MEILLDHWAAFAAIMTSFTAIVSGIVGFAFMNIKVLFQQTNAHYDNLRESMDANNREVQKQINGLTEKVSGLDKQVGILGQKVTHLDEKVTKLDDRVGNLETKVTNLDKKVDGLEIKVSNMGKEVTHLGGMLHDHINGHSHPSPSSAS